MSSNNLDGTGALVIWTDIAADAEDDFNGWYDHQHLEERVNVPGFLNGRRYEAIDEQPFGPAPGKFLAWYEVETPDVLGSAAYGARQANPTAWTSRIMPRFLNVTRVTSARIAKSGGGLGRVAASVSFSCPDDVADETATWLAGAMETLTVHRGVVAAQAWRPSGADAASGTTEAELRASEENPPVWCVMLEATSEAAAEIALTQSSLATEIASRTGKTATVALYALILARGDLG